MDHWGTRVLLVVVPESGEWELVLDHLRLARPRKGISRWVTDKSEMSHVLYTHCVLSRLDGTQGTVMRWNE
jgi:hypothetical protein